MFIINIFSKPGVNDNVLTSLRGGINMQGSILKVNELGFMWETEDPFIFCAHHHDHYPKGEVNHGPLEEALKGRRIGNDFEIKDGWRMYHGRTVPGFPAHPHRGMETVTIVLEGFVDHSDSHGSAGRYGDGDVQWMTAGAGLQHAEMFPLLYKEKENPLHLFQVWLNLPSKDKFADPEYKMLWSEDIPIIERVSEGAKASVRLVAGSYDGIEALEPTPDSWAHDRNNRVNMWLVTLEPGASINLPAVNETITRNIYYYEGESLAIDGTLLQTGHQAKLRGDQEITIRNGSKPSEFLLLEGEPIGDPVIQYGPFVMNSKEEIIQASRDFQATEFGGWPWKQSDPVHFAETVRFSRYRDGREEKPGKQGS